MESFDSLDYKRVEEKILHCIKDFAGDKKVVIGLSGGIDSSLVCALTVKALGKDKVKAIIIKNSRYLRKGLDIARKFAKEHGLEIQEVDTEEMRKTAIKNLGINESDIIHNATLDARICDTIIKTVAGLEDRIYPGTINGTERLTGWYPKGNLVGDFCPIGGLLKEQEKRLAKQMGLGYLVETISEDASKICSGCGELPEFKGIPYEALDEILFIYETSKGDGLAKRLRHSGISKEVYSRIINRIISVQHKSDVFPHYCKINFPNGD